MSAGEPTYGRLPKCHYTILGKSLNGTRVPNVVTGKKGSNAVTLTELLLLFTDVGKAYRTKT